MEPAKLKRVLYLRNVTTFIMEKEFDENESVMKIYQVHGLNDGIMIKIFNPSCHYTIEIKNIFDITPVQEISVTYKV